jgi:tryptophan-rich sensory protein
MKYVEYLAIAAALAGALLNKLSLPGATIFIILGLGSLAFIYGLAGTIFFKIQENRGTVLPFVVFSSIALTAGVLSLLFSHLNWDGKGLLAVISFICIPLAILIHVYQMSRNAKNPLNKMIVIRGIVLLVALIVF